MKEKIITTIVVVLLIALVVYFFPVWMTNIDLRKAAQYAERNDAETGVMPYNDGWFEPIRLYRFNDKENERIIYHVKSAGRDGVFDTDDDMEDARIDTNWSKKFGKAAAESGKEVFKGIIEGLKKKSKHEKD